MCYIPLRTLCHNYVLQVGCDLCQRWCHQRCTERQLKGNIVGDWASEWVSFIGCYCSPDGNMQIECLWLFMHSHM